VAPEAEAEAGACGDRLADGIVYILDWLLESAARS
jgi:hypothetical protein